MGVRTAVGLGEGFSHGGRSMNDGAHVGVLAALTGEQECHLARRPGHDPERSRCSPAHATSAACSLVSAWRASLNPLEQLSRRVEIDHEPLGRGRAHRGPASPAARASRPANRAAMSSSRDCKAVRSRRRPTRAPREQARSRVSSGRRRRRGRKGSRRCCPARGRPGGADARGAICRSAPGTYSSRTT